MDIKKKYIMQIFETTGLDKKILNAYVDLAKVFYESGYEKGFQDGCFELIDRTIKEAKKGDK